MRHLPAIVLAALLYGCGIHVVPVPPPGATVNEADRSVTQEKKGVTVSARVQNLEVAPYRLENNVTSFYLAVVNNTSDLLTLSSGNFVLLDDGGTQYRPLSPESAQEVVSQRSALLIPYPYVGFYYMEDFDKYGAFNTFTSALPYYAENYPQDLFARALRVEGLLPGARAGGELYFPIDLATRKKVELRLYLPGSPATGPADFVFPFRVEK